MRHTLVLTTAAALLLGGAALTPAGAATTIGGTGGAVGVCTAGPGSAPPFATLLATEAPGAPTYVAAAAGVITGFSHLANQQAGQVQLIVFGATPAANRATVAGKSSKLTVTPSVLNTFPVRLPVQAGSRIGIGTTVSGMACLRGGVAGDTAWVAPFDPDTSSAFVSSTNRTNLRPNVSAVIEADADGDGFGDETQDACPQSPLTQAACPTPDTTVTKSPKAKRANPRVKVKFSATVAGSTFQCQLDGKAWKACTSPFKKKLKVGKHKLKIRATSPFGITDGTPAKVKTEITR